MKPRSLLMLLLVTGACFSLDENVPAVCGAQQPAEPAGAERKSSFEFTWSQLPPLPDELGVAGPFVGVHNDALIVAGGANFPRPVWEHEKVWHSRIYVLTKNGSRYQWRDGGELREAAAYGASVSTPDGVVCMGGTDGRNVRSSVFLLRWNAETGQVSRTDLADLPGPCAYGQATLVGDTIYLAGGQSGNTLQTALSNFWKLDWSPRERPATVPWRVLPAWPGPTRSLSVTVAQHDGQQPCVYVMSGRRQAGESVQFLRDIWKFGVDTQQWSRCTNAPRCFMAGTAAGVFERTVLILGGADGSLFGQADTLQDRHPGFPRTLLVYDTRTDRWTDGPAIPVNQVTTTAVRWGNTIVIPSGEVRPRVRTPAVWTLSTTRRAAARRFP